MSDFELSKHAKDMLKERNLREEWVWRTLQTPSRKRRHASDGNVHYTKAIKERDGRVLHVIVNHDTHPYRIVTVFFDRREGRL
jgi:hypothetical protein